MEILKVLKNGPMSINEIAKEINSTWLTAKRHLRWLESMKKVEVHLKKSYVTIYRLKMRGEGETTRVKKRARVFRN